MYRITKSAFLLTWLLVFAAVIASCSKPETPRPVTDTYSPPTEDVAPQDAAPAEPAEDAARDEVVTAPEPAEDAAPADPVEPMVDPVELEPMAEVEPAPRSPDVHFVPTPQEAVDRMLELAKVTKDDLVYDLGCGDGRIVVTAAKKYGAKAKGFDIDPQRVKESRENVIENKVEDLVTIEQADIFELDLTPANVVTLYLLPQLNVRLIPQLKELKPGSRIVSHDFDMRGVEPDLVENLETSNGRSHTIYLWTTPLKIDETKVGAGENTFID